MSEYESNQLWGAVPPKASGCCWAWHPTQPGPAVAKEQRQCVRVSANSRCQCRPVSCGCSSGSCRWGLLFRLSLLLSDSLNSSPIGRIRCCSRLTTDRAAAIPVESINKYTKICKRVSVCVRMPSSSGSKLLLGMASSTLWTCKCQIAHSFWTWYPDTCNQRGRICGSKPRSIMRSASSSTT